MKKMSFNEIKGKLSREEMKKIMAGTSGGCSTKCRVPGSTGTFGCYYGGGSTTCRCIYISYACTST